MRECLHLTQLKYKGVIDLQSNLIDSGKYKVIFWDCLFTMLIPYPWFVGRTFEVYNPFLKHTIIYHYNDVMQGFLLIRLIKYIDKLLIFTVWRSCRADRVW